MKELFKVTYHVYLKGTGDEYFKQECFWIWKAPSFIQWCLKYQKTIGERTIIVNCNKI